MSAGTNRGGAGGILVRVEKSTGYGGSEVKWRLLPNIEHITLCRAFGLDEHRTAFDVPKSFVGGSGRNGRRCDGVILFLGEPIGRVTLCEPGERFKDEDPRDMWRRMGVPVEDVPQDAWRGQAGFQPG